MYVYVCVCVYIYIYIYTHVCMHRFFLSLCLLISCYLMFLLLWLFFVKIGCLFQKSVLPLHPVSITRFPLSRFSPGAGLLRLCEDMTYVCIYTYIYIYMYICIYLFIYILIYLSIYLCILSISVLPLPRPEAGEPRPVLISLLLIQTQQ